MANQTLRTDIEINTGKAEAELKGLGRAADAAAVDIDKLAKEMKSAETPAKNLASETDKTGKKVSGAMKDSEDSVVGAASAMGEAFGSGGSASDAIGSFGEVVESVAGSFGPLGPAVAVAGGLILGMFGQAAAKAAELKTRADEVFGALVDGSGQLDAAFKKQAIQDFIKANKELVKQTGALLGPAGLKELGDAVGGDQQAYEDLNKRVETTIRQQKQEKQNLENLVASGQPLNKQQQQRLEQLNDQIPEYEALNDKIDEQAGVLGEAQRSMALYAGMTQTATSYNSAHTVSISDQDLAIARNIDWQKKHTGALYDAATAAQVAKHNVELLNAAYEKKSARGTAPEGNVSYIEGQGWVYNSGPNIGKPARAAGGPVTAGMAYTVGEYGKETFVPQTNGTIVPGGAGPAASVVVNQTIATNDPARMARDTARALQRAHFRAG